MNWLKKLLLDGYVVTVWSICGGYYAIVSVKDKQYHAGPCRSVKAAVARALLRI